jgi:hypothetical protein
VNATRVLVAPSAPATTPTTSTPMTNAA